MIVAPKTLALAVFAAVALTACSGADTLLEGSDSITIQIDDEHSLGAASQDAAEYCEDT